MSNAEYCPCCGQKIVTYKHKLNRTLVEGLRALYAAGGNSTLADLGLSVTANNNFQKLKYFGLVTHGEKRTYSITKAGREFLTGVGAAPEYVFTKCGAVVGEGPYVKIYEVELRVEEKSSWEEQASVREEE